MNLQTENHARAMLVSRIFDVAFGIIAPIACVVFDPVVFRSEDRMSGSFLSNVRLYGYLEIGGGILALGYYLATRRSSAFLAGVLWGGSVFALLLGVLMLPLTIVGIFFVIGILGLTPFITSIVFFRNASRCWRDAASLQSTSRHRLFVTWGVILILGMPAVLERAVTYVTARATETVMFGSQVEFERSVRVLRLMRLVVKSDRIALAYERADNERQRERLALAYQTVTGRTVQERLDELHD